MENQLHCLRRIERMQGCALTETKVAYTRGGAVRGPVEGRPRCSGKGGRRGTRKGGRSIVMCRDRSHDRPGQGRAPRRVPKRAARPCVRVVCLHAFPPSLPLAHVAFRAPRVRHTACTHMCASRGIVASWKKTGGKRYISSLG